MKKLKISSVSQVTAGSCLANSNNTVLRCCHKLWC